MHDTILTAACFPRPDNCDGSYQSDCDPSRAYTDITGILQDQGRTQLLSYMSEYWVSNDESSEAFWEHEWATHGTCVNTIDPSCYTDYQPKEEVGDYFQKAVDLFQSRDTYTVSDIYHIPHERASCVYVLTVCQALSNAGITPDPSNTYALSDVQNALAAIHDGHVPTVLCSSGAISQVYYFFNVEGNAIDGTYYSVDARESRPTCVFFGRFIHSRSSLCTCADMDLVSFLL